MKYFCKALLLFLFVPLFSSAQSRYLPGRVVALNGDTIHGFIDFRDWDSNPAEISFKQNRNDKEKTDYSLKDINSFSVTGLATYQKFICRISMDETNISQPGGRDSSYKIDTVFLKVLQKGAKLALYSYSDELKTRYYIGEVPDYRPTELSFRIYLDPKPDNSNNVVYENTYQKQLFAMAAKYQKLNSDLISTIEKSSYTKDDLLKIVSQINGVSEKEYQKRYATHTGFVFYASATVNISTTSSSSKSGYTAGGGKSSTSSLPGASVGLSIIPNTVSDKIELRAEIAVVPARFNSIYKLKVYPYTDAQASYNQLGISFMPEIIYNVYNTTKFKFYLGAGLVLTHYSFSNAYFGSPKSAPNAGIPEVSYAFVDNDNSFVLKGGVRIHKHFEIFFNYFSATTPPAAVYFQFSCVNKQIGVSYLFGK